MATTKQTEKKNNAYLYDPTMWEQFGLKPPRGATPSLEDVLKTKKTVMKQLTLKDRQDTISRYTWYNLPPGITEKDLERIIYYRGQGAFFYIGEPVEKFFFLPYALDGTIDCYGRYTGITPLPFGNGKADQDENSPFLPGLHRDVAYEVISIDDLEENDLESKAVLIKDYSEAIEQTNISRDNLVRDLIDVESEMLPLAHTAAMNATGVLGMGVAGESQKSSVLVASESVHHAALTQKRFVPITGGPLDLQAIAPGQVAKSEEYLLLWESIDNWRLSTIGVPNGGLFQKKAHMLQSEQSMSSDTSESALQDGLKYRQNACNIINSIWGLGIWCTLSESTAGVDKNGDGEIADDKDQNGISESSPEMTGGDSDV